LHQRVGLAGNRLLELLGNDAGAATCPAGAPRSWAWRCSRSTGTGTLCRTASAWRYSPPPSSAWMPACRRRRPSRWEVLQGCAAALALPLRVGARV
jgi:hypothetical protein